jgi:hypothetical protein
MGREKRPEPDDKEQSTRFIETAKRLGAVFLWEGRRQAHDTVLLPKKLPLSAWFWKDHS